MFSGSKLITTYYFASFLVNLLKILFDCTIYYQVNFLKSLFFLFFLVSQSTDLIKKQQLGVKKTRRQIDFSQCSDMNEIVQEEQEHNLSSQPSPLSEHASDLRKVPTPFPSKALTSSLPSFFVLLSFSFYEIYDFSRRF